MTRVRWLVLLVVLWPALAAAHVGSPDIYVDGAAGPYHLFVTVRTPTVIPGVAEIEVRAESAGIDSISAVPVPISGPGAKFAPIPDKLKRSTDDSQFFTGSLWMMAPGSWQVKLSATGPKGQGTVSIPVPSAAQSTRGMDKALRVVLFALMSFLVLGAIAISGAAVREAQLEPGVEPDRYRRARAIRTMCFAAILVAAALWFGKHWWNNDAAAYATEVYKPLTMASQIEGGTLKLSLHDPGWLNDIQSLRDLPVFRSVDDLVLDHGHLMHLYLIRNPGMDVVYHLHPDAIGGGNFELVLPSMPEGNYKLYADIVHENGFPETLVTSLHIPQLHGRALSGDDATGHANPWEQAKPVSTSFQLPDGYIMCWAGSSGQLKTRKPVLFRFELLDLTGKPAQDMALYMGMLGHAAFVKTDGTVFAHIHPNGSVSMAAFMKANSEQASANMANMEMPGMQMAWPNEVTFPYGLPSPGRYRIFVQMKHSGTVETGVFDAVAN